MYETFVIANENALLAILKQGKVVNCLAQLSNVLCMGLNVSSKEDTFLAPHTVATAKASQEAKCSARTSMLTTTTPIFRAAATKAPASIPTSESAPTDA